MKTHECFDFEVIKELLLKNIMLKEVEVGLEYARPFVPHGSQTIFASG